MRCSEIHFVRLQHRSNAVKIAKSGASVFCITTTVSDNFNKQWGCRQLFTRKLIFVMAQFSTQNSLADSQNVVRMRMDCRCTVGVDQSCRFVEKMGQAAFAVHEYVKLCCKYNGHKIAK